MKLQCPRCREEYSDNVVFRQRRKAGLPCLCTWPPCLSANVAGDELVVIKTKRGRSDNQKRSQRQEKRVAKNIGGRKQPGSGAMSGAKGDVRKRGEARIECKFTRAKSFSLKLSELQKIETEAEGDETPAFYVEFQGQQPHKRYVVIPEWLYESLAFPEDT